MDEKIIDEISNQLFELNILLSNFIFIYCEIHKKPLKEMDMDFGGYKFKEEKKNVRKEKR